MAERIAIAEIPADQRFSFKITPLPGRLLDATLIGGSIRALSRLHAALGADLDPPQKCKTYILGAAVEDDGSFRIDFTVLPTRQESDCPISLASEDD